MLQMEEKPKPHTPPLSLPVLNQAPAGPPLTRRPESVRVRPARAADLPGIVYLVNEYARRGDLLPRTIDSIRANLADWVIAVADDGIVVGCGSLLLYEPTLAEVRSLAVADIAQGMGLGRGIVAALIEEAQRRSIPTLFALTRAVPFFQRMGFALTEKDRFPQKIWNDCQICHLKDACDEIAVVLELAPTYP